MIQHSYNAISTGARGQFGRQVVLYVRYGALIIAKAPRKRPGRGTDAQERTKANFRNGAQWSAKVRKSVILNEMYKAKRRGALNVHNLAIADFLQAPVIHDIELNDAGIIITATDNVKVAAVKVSIYNSNGKLIETGVATQDDEKSWCYNPERRDLRGCRLVVTANDLPGNETVQELALEGEFVDYAAPHDSNEILHLKNISYDNDCFKFHLQPRGVW
ncbi:hypothetical protein MKQ68_10395 [Chitinophaga horti]|uniref:Uncharacterized protein n=1 Tax=Chitinophaga horti TaxID=2920382 RepID=A0ABY6J748_9BACT|nr:hypothetical protein [Chitinophaga horti]UYQ95509.1 hypothetical protein MKQ68_10395 [Chitinophaga horti]